MMEVSPAGAADLQWLSARAGCPLTAWASGIVAKRRDGSIAGVVGFDFWTDNAARCHLALDTPMAARALKPAVARYAFGQQQVDRLLANVRSDNERVQKLLRHLGFKEVYREPEGFSRGVDMVLYRVTREEWRNG